MHRRSRFVGQVLGVLVVALALPRTCYGQFAGNLTGVEIEDLLLLDRVLQLSPAQMAGLLDAHDEYVERIAADKQFWLRPYDQNHTMKQRIAYLRQAADDYRTRARQLRAHDRILFAAIEPTLAEHQTTRLPIARAMIDRRLFSRAIAEIDQTGKRFVAIDRLLLLAEWSDGAIRLPEAGWVSLAQYALELNRRLATLEDIAIKQSVKTLRQQNEKFGIADPDDVDPELSLELIRSAREPWLEHMAEIDDLNDRTLLALIDMVSVENTAHLVYAYGNARYPRGHPTWNGWYGLAHVAEEMADLVPEHSADEAREQMRSFIFSEGVAHIRSAIDHLREHRPRRVLAFARANMSAEERQAESSRNLELVKVEYELGNQMSTALEWLWQTIADGDAEQLEVLQTAELRHMRALRDAGGPSALPKRPTTSPLVPVLMSIAEHDLRALIFKFSLDDAQYAAALAAIDTYRQTVSEHDKHSGELVPDEIRVLLRDAGRDLLRSVRAVVDAREAHAHAALDRLAEAIERASWFDRHMFLEGITRADAGRFVLFHPDVDLATLAVVNTMLHQWHEQALPMFHDRVRRYRIWQAHRNDPDIPRDEKTSLHPLHQAVGRVNVAIGKANADWIERVADELGMPALREEFLREVLPHLYQRRDRLIEQFDVARALSETTPTLNERVQDHWAEFITNDTDLHEQMLAIAVRTVTWSPSREGLLPMGVDPADHRAYRALLEQRNDLHARIAVRLRVLVEAARQ